MRIVATTSMRRVAIAALVTTLGLSITGASSDAQSVRGQFGVLAGATFPNDELNDELETGFNLGVTLGLRSPVYPVALRIDAAWHQLSLATSIGGESERLRIVTGSANLLYDLPLPFRPYAIGGIGAYNLRDSRFEGDANEFGWNLGAGIRPPLLSLETFVELRFHRISGEGDAMTIVPISVGVMF